MIDPAFLLVAWDRVRGNGGARTAGVDGRTAMSIALGTGVEQFLDALRSSLKSVGFVPAGPGADDPNANGKLRRLGIATIAADGGMVGRQIGAFGAGGGLRGFAQRLFQPHRAVSDPSRSSFYRRRRCPDRFPPTTPTAPAWEDS